MIAIDETDVYDCWNCGQEAYRSIPHACDTEPAGYAEYDGPVCCYCGEPLPADTTDYCSALCACHADRDNREDR